MACNAHNHGPECECAFRGGRKRTQRSEAPPATLFGDLAPPMFARPRVSGRVKSCERCGMMLRFIPGRGGGAFFASSVDPLLKHRCPRTVPSDRPRVLKSRWRREGWYPAAIRSSRCRAAGDAQVLKFAPLMIEKPFRVCIEDGLRIDPTKPVMFRHSPDDRRVIEIGYLDNTTGELTVSRARARRLR